MDVVNYKFRGEDSGEHEKSGEDKGKSSDFTSKRRLLFGLEFSEPGPMGSKF